MIDVPVNTTTAFFLCDVTSIPFSTCTAVLPHPLYRLITSSPHVFRFVSLLSFSSFISDRAMYFLRLSTFHSSMQVGVRSKL